MNWLIWTILACLYLCISLFAVYMTYREHRRNGQRSLVLSGLSYLLCAVWPLPAAGMLVFARRRPAELAPAERN